MARNRRVIEGADEHDVFDVLRDGKRYADWVVGTRKIRDVDPGWPQPGAAIHYTAGRGPLRKDDVTESMAYEPERLLRLQAQAWPFGSARIVLTAEPAAGGVAVTIEESPDRGVLRLVHNPLLDLAIKARNVETLRRFEKVLREKQRSRSTSG